LTFAGRNTRTPGLMGTPANIMRAALLGVVLAAVAAPVAVAAPAWITPKTLSASGQDANVGDIAVDAAGDAFAIWKRSDGSNMLTQVAVRKAGGKWGAPKTLSASGREADYVQIAASPGGAAIAIWSRDTATASIVQVSVRPAGGHWGSVQDLTADGVFVSSPQVAFDRRGNAIAVWVRGGNVQASVRPRGGAWGSPQDISVPGVLSGLPQVEFDRQGTATAVWYRATLGPFTETVQSSVHPRGGAWGLPQDVSEPGVLAVAPQIGIDRAGNAIALWADQTVSPSAVQASIRPHATGVWGSPKTISKPGANTGSPELAVSPKGGAVAVWNVSNGPLRFVQAALRPAGGRWHAPKNLTPTGGSAYAPDVGTDAAGNAVAVWHRTGTEQFVQASRHPAGGRWSKVKPVSKPSSGIIPFPSVAVDPAGNAVAIWQRTKNSDDVFEVAALDVAGPVFSRVRIPRRVSVGSRHTFSVHSLDVWTRLARPPLWDFGDGTEVRGRSVTHAFFGTGRVRVTVRQRDLHGNLTVLRRFVVVHP
jgi:hypothetical protein